MDSMPFTLSRWHLGSELAAVVLFNPARTVNSVVKYDQYVAESYILRCADFHSLAQIGRVVRTDGRPACRYRGCLINPGLVRLHRAWHSSNCIPDTDLYRHSKTPW